MNDEKKPLTRSLIGTVLATALLISSSHADGVGTSGGLTLIEAAGARAAALGEAVSASADDVTAAVYNPAALATLTSSQVSFSYQRGIADDRSGRLHLGRPNLGLSISYYSAGDVDLLDGGSTRSVNAQTDLALSLGAARTRGRFSIGGALKFISSELAETDRATAIAADFGIRTDISDRFRLSSALQNIGTELKFDQEGDPLPRILRVGAEIVALQGRAPLSIHLEAPYRLNERELNPAIGAEVRAGPLAFRAGYKTGSDVEGLSLGTGFTAGSLLIDYSFGFVEDLDSRQRLSVGFRFGGARAAGDVRVPAPVISAALVHDAALTEEPVVAVETPVAIFNGGDR